MTTNRSADVSQIDGRWRCRMETPIGEQTVELTLTTDDGALSGRAQTPLGPAEFDGGTVDGEALAWSMSLTEPMAIELEFRATVQGDALTGTVAAGPFGQQPFSGERL
jgi:hypothetical protein